jgi:hypothetical protein
MNQFNEFLGESFRPKPFRARQLSTNADVVYFETREDARIYCGEHGIPQSKIVKNIAAIAKRYRWFV